MAARTTPVATRGLGLRPSRVAGVSVGAGAPGGQGPPGHRSPARRQRGTKVGGRQRRYISSGQGGRAAR
eukprot:9480764-Pyramimonas_sp.AAC.1